MYSCSNQLLALVNTVFHDVNDYFCVNSCRFCTFDVQY